MLAKLKNKRFQLNKKGFTLAELLVVVAIIAVLVAVAIPVFSSATDKAQVAVEKANARSTYAEAAFAYLTAETPADAEKIAKGFPRSYDGITYTAVSANNGETWTVTFTPASKGTGSYTFGADISGEDG